MFQSAWRLEIIHVSGQLYGGDERAEGINSVESASIYRKHTHTHRDVMPDAAMRKNNQYIFSKVPGLKRVLTICTNLRKTKMHKVLMPASVDTMAECETLLWPEAASLTF